MFCKLIGKRIITALPGIYMTDGRTVMKYFDLHCDTLSKMAESGLDFSSEELHVNAGQARLFEEYYQVFAFFTDDTRPLAGIEKKLEKAALQFPKLRNVTPFFAIEGGGVLQGDLKNLDRILPHRPCFFSLCWNGKNAFACGNMTDPNRGLSKKGRKLIELLEENHIFLDVSHLSDAGFSDVTRFSKRTLVATHSNARSVCPHPRNCTDRQLQEIFERGGLCGLNFYPPFVGKEPEEILRHIDHMLKLGGENQIAVGGDWDGMTPFPGIDGINGVPFFYEMTEKTFGKSLADRIFFNNAYAFFQRHALLK